MEHTLAFDFGSSTRPSGLWNESWNENTGFSIGCVSGTLNIGTSEASTKIMGDPIKLISAMLGTVLSVDLDGLEILGKYVSWKQNSDGTFTLIGQ